LNRRHWIIAAAVAVLAAVAVGAYQRYNAKPPVVAAAKAAADRVKLAADAPQLSFLKVEAATEGPLPAAGPFNGRLTLADDLTARIYPPVSGRVVQLVASLGDKVDKGSLLAVLDSPDFGAALADAKKAEADAALKNHALVRAKTLYAGEAIARRDLEGAEADAAASRAESERARLRLANLAPSGAKLEGERLQLRSPISGIVVDRQANPGTEVRADGAVALFVVSDISRLWLSLDLPEKESGVHQGDTVVFSVDTWLGEQFTAKVDRVSPVVDPTTRRIPVRATVDNKAGRLRPEMYARAIVADPAGGKALRLPTSAVLTQGLTAVLFVEASPGEFVRRPVKVLRQDREYVYLAEESGIKAGDRIVVKGAMLLASELAGAE